MGRPKKSEEERRGRQIRVRLTPKEADQLKEAAKKLGTTESALIRGAVSLIFIKLKENNRET